MSLLTIPTPQLSEDEGTDFSGESFSGINWAASRESLPLFEQEELWVFESFIAFRFDCVGLVSAFSSPESMMIISADVDGEPIGVDWVAERKKGCRFVFRIGVAFSFFGLLERGMKWDEGGGTPERRYKRESA